MKRKEAKKTIVNQDKNVWFRMNICVGARSLRFYL